MDSRPSLILPSTEILNKFLYKVNTKLQLIAGSMICGLQFTNKGIYNTCLQQKEENPWSRFLVAYQQ